MKSSYLILISLFVFTKTYSQGVSCGPSLYRNFALLNNFDPANDPLKKESKLLKSTILNFSNDSTNFRVAFLNLNGFMINTMNPMDLVNRAIEINPTIPEYHFLKAVLIYNEGIWTDEAMEKACPELKKALDLGLNDLIIESICFKEVSFRCK